MAFKKGYKMIEEHKKNLIKSCLGRTPWNKGLTKKTDKRVLKNSIATSIGTEGRILSKETREKISDALHGRKITWGDKISKTRLEKIKEGTISYEYTTGENNPNFGKHLSEETKRIIREKKIGRTNILTSGVNHYNWKGGITDENSKRLKLQKWKELAEKIRIRDNNTCQYCGKPGNNKKLPVHHIIPFIISKSDNERNLITL